MHFDIATGIGFLGGFFYLASHYMKAMVPLRVLSLGSNALFITFGVLHVHFELIKLLHMPEVLLNVILLPMNAKRLVEILRLTKQIEAANSQSPVSEWLLPHMHRKKYKAGHVLFRRGDKADAIFYVASGQLKLEGVDHAIGPGGLVGEIGVFSPDNRRTLTIECDTDCELYEMTAEQIYRLYYQNPRLGFYFMKLIVERLLCDVQRYRVEAEKASEQ